MKIAFYCRVDGQGFGFVLPDEADKLREFFAEHQDKSRYLVIVRTSFIIDLHLIKVYKTIIKESAQ